MTTRNFLTTVSLLGMAVAMPATAFAQDAAAEDPSNGEIVVTAQRRAERSVDVPITVATLSAETLTTANVRELGDISKITPGLRFDNAGAFVQPTIRGIGTAVTTSGGGGNVGIYVDGFYSPNPLATNMQLLNVESIQVLKGPQGTLFGRNTTGGAILVSTKDPSTETSGQVKLSYGRFNEFRGQAYATTGLGENLALDVEGLYSRGDGWQRDISNGLRRVGGYENWSVRVGMKTGLVTDLRRSPERLELATGDRRDDQAHRRVQAGGGADCADQRITPRPGCIGFGDREVDAGQMGVTVSAI